MEDRNNKDWQAPNLTWNFIHRKNYFEESYTSAPDSLLNTPESDPMA
jgi:hypothetical protein